MQWIEEVRARDNIADLTKKANEQHYEVRRKTCLYACTRLIDSQVPTDFMLSCLGPYAKYSSCLYPTGNEALDEAEVLMMELYCERAAISDGMDVLDLGCGMCITGRMLELPHCQRHVSRLGKHVTLPRSGVHREFEQESQRSLHHTASQKYPKSRIVGLSNSRTQKAYIESSARSRGLHNVEVRAIFSHLFFGLQYSHL